MHARCFCSPSPSPSPSLAARLRVQTREQRDVLLEQLLTLVRHFNEGHPLATQDIALSSCGTKPLVEHAAEAQARPKTDEERVAGGVLKLDEVGASMEMFTL